jgi:hypothetical protein
LLNCAHLLYAQVVGGFLFLLFGVHALWQGPQ